MLIQTRSARHRLLRNAIFTICGSREPTTACLSDICRRAAKIAGRAKPWGHRHLYVLLHLDRYDADKYPITDELLKSLISLSGREATNGKRVVKVYAHQVRPFAVILMRSRKCARPSCHTHFVGLGNYCSDKCRTLYTKHLRKQAAKRKRRAELLRRRRAQRKRHTRRSR